MSTPPSGPHSPLEPKIPNLPPPGAQGIPSESPAPGEDISNSPFSKMFPTGATPQQLRQFLNTFLQMMIFEFKQSDAHWKQSQQQMKKVSQGKDPDE